MTYNDMTWLVNLWIDNDEGEYNYWEEIAQSIADEAQEDHVCTREQAAKYELANRMENEFEERACDAVSNTGLFADMLSRSIKEVDWYKVAESRLENVDWPEDEEVEV